MNESLVKNSRNEYLEITKMVLKGNTIAQIAKNLNYSESTVSNRLNNLMQKYNAKNRFEFIYNFFSQIIQKYKLRLESVQYENKELKEYILKIKSIIQEAKKCPYNNNGHCKKYNI